MATTSTLNRVEPRVRPGIAKTMLNKVPEVTLYFWVIKVLCTTVGETAADFLNDNLGFGLTTTTVVMSAVLAVALVFQFRLRRYVPGVYWLAVVLISIVGTLITDNLTDNFGISLVTTTIVFSAVLAATFAVWWASERTLSIHTIVTTRREAFYWLAVLFTFALGTAAGPADFVMLVPNPAHLAFDRVGKDIHEGEQVLAQALPPLELAVGAEVEGRVASSPNAFDDILAELGRRSYTEIILETLPAHVSHWLHVDLSQRLAHLGYRLTTVTATH